jgi:formyl-CoA transferase
MTSPLDGLLVADFSRVLAGPLATMHLADLGATVVKVERPGVGDETRAWGPPWTAQSSSYFECVNRSKYSVTFDLDDPRERAEAVQLATRADVVVENFRPGSMARFGLDYHSVVRVNPKVVYCSISGFGSEAGADKPGYDFLVQAVGGLMSITGEADGEPTKVGVALVDVLTGKDAVIGILAALADRARSGRGDHIQVDLLSSLLGGLANQASSYLTTGHAPVRMGNRHPSIAPYETLRCADTVIAVACGNDGQFRRLAEAVGRPDLADDARFATNADRVEHREELATALEVGLRHQPAAVWEHRLTAVGVPAGLVGDLGSAIKRSAELGLQPTVDVGPGWVPQIRHPVRYARSRTAPATPPPEVGEHNELVRRWNAGTTAGLRRAAPDPPETQLVSRVV